MTKENLMDLIDFYEQVQLSIKGYLSEGKSLIDGDTIDSLNELDRVIDNKRLAAYETLEYRRAHGESEE